MPKASELRKGHVVDINGALYRVLHIDVRSPSSRGAQTLYKVRFNQLPNGGKRDETFTGDDMLTAVALERRQVSFLYREGNVYTFMDQENYSQYSIDEEVLSEQLPFLSDGLEGLNAMLVDDQLIALELPTNVSLEIVECMPGMQAASATGRTKPAKCTNGYELQVPEYIKEGELIKVSTETGKFLSRM
ncbi:elongation factor P-like protein YeiP [Neptunomonas antarctica]|uniref:Elongation factor P-like protein n=1 Tax=Neptunomonas antarctica TaxID=619304 RepID=A0A1N7NWC7_9GAMM|nr:elongation factor P-like protein YeiP [Neptunomonas antarctica]SIT02634.1 elongation factor P [Neptunomonas antarctica]